MVNHGEINDGTPPLPNSYIWLEAGGNRLTGLSIGRTGLALLHEIYCTKVTLLPPNITYLFPQIVHILPKWKWGKSSSPSLSCLWVGEGEGQVELSASKFVNHFAFSVLGDCHLGSLALPNGGRSLALTEKLKELKYAVPVFEVPHKMVELTLAPLRKVSGHATGQD